MQTAVTGPFFFAPNRPKDYTDARVGSISSFSLNIVIQWTFTLAYHLGTSRAIPPSIGECPESNRPQYSLLPVVIPLAELASKVFLTRAERIRVTKLRRVALHSRSQGHHCARLLWDDHNHWVDSAEYSRS